MRVFPVNQPASSGSVLSDSLTGNGPESSLLGAEWFWNPWDLQQPYLDTSNIPDFANIDWSATSNANVDGAETTQSLLSRYAGQFQNQAQSIADRFLAIAEDLAADNAQAPAAIFYAQMAESYQTLADGYSALMDQIAALPLDLYGTQEWRDLVGDLQEQLFPPQPDGYSGSALPGSWWNIWPVPGTTIGTGEPSTGPTGDSTGNSLTGSGSATGDQGYGASVFPWNGGYDSWLTQVLTGGGNGTPSDGDALPFGADSLATSAQGVIILPASSASSDWLSPLLSGNGLGGTSPVQNPQDAVTPLLAAPFSANGQ